MATSVVCRPSVPRAQAAPIPRLERPDIRLYQATPIVTRGTLRTHAALPSDQLQVPVAACRRGLCVVEHTIGRYLA